MKLNIKTRKDLFAIADAKGYIRKQGRKNPTLKIYEDGTILRVDVRLDLARAMTVKEARQALEA